MRRSLLATSAALGLLFALAFAVPALGGPTLKQLATRVARAVKLAGSADTRSRHALHVALTRPAVGPKGSRGATGPRGPTGPSGTGGTGHTVKVDFRAPVNTPNTQVFNHDGLVITARCDPGPNLHVEANSTIDNSELHAEALTRGTPPIPVYKEDDHLGPTTSVNPLVLPSTNAQGTLTYSTPGGAVVTLTYAAEQSAFGTHTPAIGCWFAGWAQY